MAEWINVKDRLPDKNGRYLCFDGMYMHIYRFATNFSELDQYDFDGITGSGFCEYDREWGYTEISDVTHWMPLPEAPKGDHNG